MNKERAKHDLAKLWREHEARGRGARTLRRDGRAAVLQPRLARPARRGPRASSATATRTTGYSYWKAGENICLGRRAVLEPRRRRRRVDGVPGPPRRHPHQGLPRHRRRRREDRRTATASATASSGSSRSTWDVASRSRRRRHTRVERRGARAPLLRCGTPGGRRAAPPARRSRMTAVDHDAGMTPRPPPALRSALHRAAGTSRSSPSRTRRRGEAAPPSCPTDLPAALREALLAAGIAHALRPPGRRLRRCWRPATTSSSAPARRAARASASSSPSSSAFAARPAGRALFLFPTKALAQDQARKLSALRAARRRRRPSTTATRRRTQRALLRRTATDPAQQPRHAARRHPARATSAGPSSCTTCATSCSTRRTSTAASSAPRRPGRAPPAAPLRAVRRRPPVRAHLGDDRQPARPSPSGSSACRSTVVDEDQAPRPERTVVLWNPPLEDPARGARRSALAEASYVTAESVLAGARVIAFAPTRKAAELIYGHVRRRLEDRDPARRGGARAAVPRRLHAAAAPRHRAAPVRPRARRRDRHPGARAGHRRRQPRRARSSPASPARSPACASAGAGPAGAGHGCAVLVAGQDALDQYFMREPERLLGRSVEEAIIDLHNPHICGAAPRGGRLRAAAHAGRRAATSASRACCRPSGWRRPAACGGASDGLVWARPHSPAAGSACAPRATSSSSIVEARQGEVIGTVERERVFRFAHPGAVYLHLGQSYLVQHLDLEARTVLVDDFDGSYYTQAKTDKNVLDRRAGGLARRCPAPCSSSASSRSPSR